MKDNYSTRSVWAGEEESYAERSTQVPVFHTVTYGYDDLDDWYDVALGKQDGHIYSRNSNPTVSVFESKLKELEGAEAATSFSTGMAAISNTLFTFLRPGDRVVSIKDSYGGTSKLFLDFLPAMHVEVCLVETGDHEQMQAEIAKGCKLVYLETPTNPTLKLVDIELLCKAAADVQAISVVDNTFATPINQNPLALGADLVLHSATKFLGGHSDAMGGVLCGPQALIDQVYHYREITGATLHPMSAYLLLRGIKTLDLRIQRHNSNAMAVAEHLQADSRIKEVFYPGLKTHHHHDVAKKQMRGFGGMLSFSLHGGYESVKQFLPKLRYAHLAAHLGGVETIAGPPKVTSHVENTPEEREALGIPEGLIRYSAGIENVEDLLDDLDQALDSIG
ncbi:MAG: cystathionine gamma-synthase family protein [Gammaproteobacteria bacterium]